ncbi:hypothetical protein AVEN_268842-1 [Araneus ventricosus]|uniref:Uncharacterized protein n=1 Tax=Araneus ventricosus TaxID=182803 RepID=A0A4Y2UF82_ARAVE|nr:hypothetical protein AVEN_268842-1 [Araneus ventricosus]
MHAGSRARTWSGGPIVGHQPQQMALPSRVTSENEAAENREKTTRRDERRCLLKGAEKLQKSFIISGESRGVVIRLQPPPELNQNS